MQMIPTDRVPAEWATSDDVCERRAARVDPRPGTEYPSWGGGTRRLIAIETRGGARITDYLVYYVRTEAADGATSHRCDLDLFCAVVDGAPRD